MEELHYNQLVRIYNTLFTISTKGDDTLTMAECLKALKNLLMEIGPVEQK